MVYSLHLIFSECSDFWLQQKKKKKHKKKKITGLEVYVEERKDAYKLEHPDLEDEEVESKLRRKYGKLSDKKMVMYNLS